MRITNKMLANSFLSDMRLNLQNLKTIQQQMTSGKEIRKPSDDPFKVARSMQLHTDIDTNKQYNENIKDTVNWLDETDTALGQLGEQMKRVRDLLLSSGDVAYGSDERQKIKDEINEIVGTIAQTLNSNFDGKYLFGGTRGTKKPLDVKEYTSSNNTINNKLVFRDDDGSEMKSLDDLKKEVSDATQVKNEKLDKSIQNLETIENDADTPDLIKNEITKVKDAITKAKDVKALDSVISDLEKIEDDVNTPEAAKKEITAAKELITEAKKAQETANTTQTKVDKIETARTKLETAETDLEKAPTDAGKIKAVEDAKKELAEVDSTSKLDLLGAGGKIDKNKSKLVTEISQGVDIEYNITAGEVIKFQNNKGEAKDLREIFKNITDHLDDPEGTSKLTDEDLQNVDDIINNVLKLRSKVGAKQNRMESAEEKNLDENFNMTEILSKTEDINITEKVMEYATMSVVYMASLQTSAKVLQPTLMDYLR